jgi:hypothetical protein
VGEAVPLGCREVRGFHEAAGAARDPRATPPSRLVLIGLDEGARAWVSAWSEDSERVRRTLTIRRMLDDLTLTAVATLASFGRGVETALALESVSADEGDGLPAALLRSGVHPKAIIEAALGAGTIATVERDDAGWFVHR